MKRVFLFSLCASLCFAQNARLAVPYTLFSLPDGLTVILHEDHTTPTVSVNVWYHVGSARERPGRTGFAHLFEHLMFEGSAHVPEGKFDQWLEAAGGENNGSTTPDRTNYWENVPSNALELALFLESDRMGYLLSSMTPDKVNTQRDVVKNERRQSYENRPYGMASIIIRENLFPPDHPYHWPTIGSMADLSAASYEDVVGFFKKYYGPNNASLCVAGDIDPARTKALVEKWFSDVPAGPPVPPLGNPAAALTAEERLVMQDGVQLPRLYLDWLTPPVFAPGDAALDVLAGVLAGGESSRLYKRLVYEMQIAQDVTAYQASSPLCSYFQISATARAGHTLEELERVIQEEIDSIRAIPPSAHEVQRVVNQQVTGFLDRLEIVGGFGGKADQLNFYYSEAGDPDYFNEDLSRYRALDSTDVHAAARAYLGKDRRVMLSVVPSGRADLAVEGSKEVK